MSSQKIVASTSGRLDKVLSQALSQSRNQIEKLICEGMVTVGNKIITKSSHKLTIGDEIGYAFKEAEKNEPGNIDFDVEILYEDDDILVVNKPSGLVVHPAPSVKEPTLVDWLIYKGISLSTISGQERHGIVHRIDKETTGALVVAKNNEAHQSLSEQLQDKSMGRYYLAIINIPLKENVVIEKPIFRSPHNRLKMAIVDNGRDARTKFVRVAEGDNGTALVAAKLYTGRTHQIRVHLESINRNILGDEMYGYKPKNGKVPRVYLHAYMLYLIHPSTNKRIEIIAPLFDDMSSYLSKHYNKGDIDEKIQADNFSRHFDNNKHTI